MERSGMGKRVRGGVRLWAKEGAMVGERESAAVRTKEYARQGAREENKDNEYDTPFSVLAGEQLPGHS